MSRLFRIAIAAALALSAVAYLRVRLEREDTVPTVRHPDGTPLRDTSGAPGLLDHARRPAASRPNPAARDVPPSWEPRLLTMLARWVPARPQSPAARVLAYLWAGPLSLAGLAVGRIGGGRARWHDGALLFTDTGGPMGAYLRARGFSACTLGHVIVAVGQPSESLLAHELVHTRQAERFGPFMAPLYAALLAVYGYARNPLERAARRVQRAVQ